MARKHPRSYLADFRLKIVELARLGRGVDDLAREFKLAPQTVRNWSKLATWILDVVATVLQHQNAKNSRSCVKKTGSSGLNAKFWEKQRPGSHARPIRFLNGLRIVKAHQAVRPIATQCRVLGVSPSGYYAWLKRPMSARQTSNIELGKTLSDLYEASRGTYGRPRLQANLRELGIFASDKRVAREMR